MLLTTTALLMGITQPGFNSFTDVYPTAYKEFESVVDTIPTVRRFEVTSEIRMMGAAQLTQEGTASYSDTINQKGVKTFYVNKYTLMINPTYEIISDDLYKEMNCPAYGTGFMQSHIERQNQEAFSVMNEGWTFNNVGWDNQPWFSNEHPFDFGVQSNTLPYASPLHEESANRLMSRIWYMKAYNGIPIPENQAKGLIVAPPLLPQGTILALSPTRTGTSSLELNPVNVLSYFDKKVLASRYVLPNAYFFQTHTAGFKRFLRDSLRTLQAPDPQNWSLIISSSMRYITSFDNWRSMFSARAPLVQSMT
jgi:hypothetical protein